MNHEHTYSLCVKSYLEVDSYNHGGDAKLRG
jgi:hypothetical protein